MIIVPLYALGNDDRGIRVELDDETGHVRMIVELESREAFNYWQTSDIETLKQALADVRAFASEEHVQRSWHEVAVFLADEVDRCHRIIEGHATDIARSLVSDEARELAAVLAYYATEADR